MNRLRSLLASHAGPSTEAGDAVRGAADILRPAGALARLDDLAAWVAEWQGSAVPAVHRPAALIFAADHGVAAAGVSAYPIEVTAAMLAAYEAHRSTVTAFAAVVEARRCARSTSASAGPLATCASSPRCRWNASPNASPPGSPPSTRWTRTSTCWWSARWASATRRPPRQSPPHCLVAIPPSGWAAARVWTTTASPASAAVAAGVSRLVAVGVSDPLEVLRQLGGAELVALAAAVVAARHRGLPVLLDGYVVTAAVLPLAAAVPDALAHCRAGHCSAEPGHRRLLQRLGMEPLLDLGMRLGEGSGALAAVPLVQMACAGITDVPTFAEWFGPTPT